jgi:hypothetical protein
LERVEKAEHMGIGILTHEIMEHWYQTPYKLRSVKRMVKIAKQKTKACTFRELTTEHRSLVIAMCIGWAEWVLLEDNDMNDRAIGVRDTFAEEWFELPIVEDGSILVRGRLDNRFVPVNEHKVMAVMETKTRGQFRDENIEQMMQLSVYLWAIMKKYPKQKRYVMYYQRMRKQLPGPRVTAPLFDRQEIERETEELMQWQADTARVARDMLDGAVYPSPMDSCAWACDFPQACLLRGRPADLKHVLTTEFKPREKR